MRNKNGKARLALNTAIVVFTLLILMPFLWFVSMGFKSNDDIMAGSASALFIPTLANYAGLMTRGFIHPFGNSLEASLTSTLLSLVIGVPGAYALARAPLKLERPLSLLILASRMVPPIAFTIPYVLVDRYADLRDTITGLVLIYMTFNLSLVIWLMRTFFESTPRSLEEAAWIDGASLWLTFRSVVLPLCTPAVMTTGVLCFVFSWNDFFFALTLTREQAMTAPVEVVNFMNYQGWDWGKIAASGTLILLPVFVFSLLMRRFLVHGMTAGAVKG
ncbi:MAG: carbohydrate ABC transporter permease [Rhodospirillales bacterium]|nr:carbohydrate ABC transporter permease [Rhodospirillales bacterium]